MTEEQLELLRDKYVLWERDSRTGNMELRDYHRRCAEALKAALSEISDAPQQASALGNSGLDRATILAVIQAWDDSIGSLSGLAYEDIQRRLSALTPETKP